MITFSDLGKAGRLGNQLWEIASTIGIAKSLGESVGFKDWEYRKFFSLPDELFPMFPSLAVQSYQTPLVDHMDPRCRQYLQDWNLWTNVEEEVRGYFRPSPSALERVQSQCAWYFDLPHPICAVHVRRGDALKPGNNEFHSVHTPQYYYDAIDLVGEYESLVFFSEDTDWCREEFSHLGSNVHMFEEGEENPNIYDHGYDPNRPLTDWIDFFAMSMADKHIIANSSYSWWAAFLSTNRSPIYPTPWYGHRLDHIDWTLMIPPEWKALEDPC